MRYLIASLALLIFAPLVGAQFDSCPTCTAPADAPLSLNPAPAGFVWWKYTNDPSHLTLFKDGRQVGAYDIGAQIYRPLLSYRQNRWGNPTDPPQELPGSYQGQAMHFGVGPLTAPAQTRYRITDGSGTRDVSRDEAHKITKDGIPDYSTKFRLVVIGADAERKRVLDDFAAADAKFKDAVIAQSYAPDRWEVKDVGYKTDGHPSIYLQSPAGVVLHAQYDYAGAADLATIAKLIAPQEAEEIRKKDPSFDPANVPDIRKGIGPLITGALPWTLLVPLVLILILGSYLLIKRHTTKGVA